MARNQRTSDLLGMLSDEGLPLFCLTCAERGRAFYELLAPGDDAVSYDELLDLAWASAGGAADEEHVAETLEAAEEQLVTQADEGDEEGPAFLAEQAGMLVLNALAAQLNPSVRGATMSSNTMETLLSNLDFVLSGERPLIRGAGQPEPPLGPLQRAERETQEAVLDRLAVADRTDIAALRDESRAVSRQILDAVTGIAERKGWLEEA